MNDIDIKHLRSAIAQAWRAREHGNHPFGAVLADADGQILLEAENSVVTEHDCTDHAETNLVRLADASLSPPANSPTLRFTPAPSRAPCARVQSIGVPLDEWSMR